MWSNYMATRENHSCHGIKDILDSRIRKESKEGRGQDLEARVTSRDRVTDGCLANQGQCGYTAADSEDSTGPRPCGSKCCRVCIALGLIATPEPAKRLPGNHRPLNTAAAVQRAARVWRALRDETPYLDRPGRLNARLREARGLLGDASQRAADGSAAGSADGSAE